MEPQLEQKESIKLMKMSKGFQWEIKIYPHIGNELNSDDLLRLELLNNKLKEKYGEVL